MALGSSMSRRGLRSRGLEVILREKEGGWRQWASGPMTPFGFSGLSTSWGVVGSKGGDGEGGT